MSEEIKHGFIPVKDIFTNRWYKIPEYQLSIYKNQNMFETRFI